MALVELDGVDEHFGEVHALKSVTLRLDGGRIGLLGPNGAGKSTLLKTLLGLVHPNQGTARVFGLDPTRQAPEVRAQIGYMPEGDAVIPTLSALQYTVLAGELCGLPRAEATDRAHQVLHYVGLGEARYRKLGTYSTGMRQRARLAQALVGDPKLLLLDEPTSGLDPRGREEMLDLIVDIPKRTRASVVLSTHILTDVERTCDSVVVMASGEVLYSGALEPLIRAEGGVVEVRCKGAPDELHVALEAQGAVVTKHGSSLHVRLPEGRGAELVLAAAGSVGAQVRHCAPLAKSLERAFLDTLDKADQLRAAQG